VKQLLPQNDLPYWVALSHCPKIGPTRWASLRRSFSTMKEVWEASANELKKTGLEESIIVALVDHRLKTNVTEKWEELAKLKIEVVNIVDERYPKLLREIYDPPALLFYRGNLNALNNNSLAVVGARQATSYGLRVAEEFVHTLAYAGLTIISGLAYGIDAAAHRATLKASGITVAVLASGLDQIYPTANQALANEMVKHGGLLLTEFPPHTAPLKQNFPYRNRVIAGLARGTLVIEAAPGSGALITVKQALEANREVFTVPGNIFSEYSKGTNELLKLGAHPVTEAQDILNVYGLESTAKSEVLPLADEQKTLLEYLSSEPLHIDELGRQARVPAAELTAQLTILELSGYVRDVGGHTYIKLT
jgi:DNA processing protein